MTQYTPAEVRDQPTAGHERARRAVAPLTSGYGKQLLRAGTQRRTSVLEVLDTLLEKGVVAQGDVVLSLADIDLVTLHLAALLSSTATLDRVSGPPAWRPERESVGPCGEVPRVERPRIETAEAAPAAPASPRVAMDNKGTDRGLLKLALTLVELLRKLMERQALRRMTAGALSEAACERLGRAFLDLDEEMADLRGRFGFSQEDLNLDLGPVGTLI